ncbi:uncharacterized protein LOC121966172 [Plectropomus leopardus]|uniref:uncharacterized protein LOC121966172 n=1 Tax=Plectropomus leopardus TaxID=160734 RepID=UPI001C4C9636|nr:uncharacterized protein LOC121966172 [Plectropomus leopardus]
MKLFYHLGASELTLLSLALLCPVPWTVTSYPHTPTAPLPTMGEEELESALLLLQAPLEEQRLVQPDAWPEHPQDPRLVLLKPREEKEEEEDRSWEEEALLRAQRGDVVPRALSGHSRESRSYQEDGDGEEGGKRNEALTSIIGGLQAVSREKGGFGFRFGRKRWTDRG